MLSTKVDFWRGLSTILQLLFAIKEGKKKETGCNFTKVYTEKDN